jgi:hypothetical protein
MSGGRRDAGTRDNSARFCRGLVWGYGAHRHGEMMAPLWALLGVFIAVVGFYIAAWIVEQLLLAAGPAIASNGVFVVSSLVGMVSGIGLCYLFYWFLTRREQTLPST